MPRVCCSLATIHTKCVVERCAPWPWSEHCISSCFEMAYRGQGVCDPLGGSPGPTEGLLLALFVESLQCRNSGAIGGTTDMPRIRRVYHSDVNGRVEMWRGGCRPNISVAASFVRRCLSGSAMTSFPHPAHRTGHADLPHPALGQDFTPSPTALRAQAGPGVRARSARRGARVDTSRPCVA
jgi:hypothetical protein